MKNDKNCPNCGRKLDETEKQIGFCMSCDAMIFTDENGLYCLDDEDNKYRYEDFLEAKERYLNGGELIDREQIEETIKEETF